MLFSDILFNQNWSQPEMFNTASEADQGDSAEIPNTLSLSGQT